MISLVQKIYCVFSERTFQYLKVVVDLKLLKTTTTMRCEHFQLLESKVFLHMVKLWISHIVWIVLRFFVSHTVAFVEGLALHLTRPKTIQKYEISVVTYNCNFYCKNICIYFLFCIKSNFPLIWAKHSNPAHFLNPRTYKKARISVRKYLSTNMEHQISFRTKYDNIERIRWQLYVCDEEKDTTLTQIWEYLNI